ncbi:MAG: ATP-binding domain-containing protein [Acidobacteriota bacterium]|nr:ATP-binding domain-containing protein [Acidobacteriota bacterium]
MAKRRFELPGIQDLSKQQEAALALSKNGQHLIVGGPGTGKTVLALIRVLRHARDGDPHVFLVHNHLLHRWSDQLAGETLSSTTWIKWFGRKIWEITGQLLPTKRADPPGGFQPIDWDAVSDLVKQVGPVKNAPYLVIDEGQDMPPQFYRSLVMLGFERFFVAADQNQQITEAHSSRKDLETELGIDTKDVVELTHNYRNSAPVAKLARAFYTGDPASPRPALPGRHGLPAWLIDYPPERLAEVCRRIVRLADRDPRTMVGVLAPNNDVRQRYLDGLCSVEGAALDHDPPAIESFYGSHQPEVRFDEGGILVINCQACKGLEFDVAVLADIDRHFYRPDDREAAMKLFYVMVARARERVVLLRQSGVESRIEEILPDDPEVLRRGVIGGSKRS